MFRALLLTTSLVVCLCLSNNPAFAANTTMDVVPHSGSYGQPFSVGLVIDGHGDKFNAAQATVSPSYGLAINDLILGDCNFSFLKTPSIQDPSFAGIIPSTYSTKCTVYTLTLVPTAKTHATISLSKTSVRRYGDAANVLSTAQNASYTLTAALPAPSINQSQSVNNPQNGLYTLNIKILTSENSPALGSTVTLTGVSDKNKEQAKTDQTGTARFTSLRAGIYDAVVLQDTKKVGETIINVSGQNHILNFSINLKAQQNNPILKDSGAVLGLSTSLPYLIGAILGIGVILGSALAFTLIKLRKTRSVPV